MFEALRKVFTRAAQRLGFLPEPTPEPTYKAFPRDPRTREVRAHLEAARHSTARRHAYENFDRAIEVDVSTDTSINQIAICKYLADDDAPFRDTLLSCLADREVFLGYAPIISQIAALLSHDSREIARSAALALSVGGERASEALNGRLREPRSPRRPSPRRVLDANRRADIEKFLAFVMP